MRGPTRRLAAALALALGLAPAGHAAKDPSEAGAYCPLPEPGEKPSCLVGAQKTYEGFFLGLETGEIDDAAIAEVEADVRARDDDRYEALSSLSFGYFTLARQLASQESPSPQQLARLERWNALLTEAWDESEEDPRFREAVRTAALDLREKAPPLSLECTDEAGRVTRCQGTEAVIRAIDARRQETGLRGALSRLLQAILPGDGDGRE